MQLQFTSTFSWFELKGLHGHQMCMNSCMNMQGLSEFWVIENSQKGFLMLILLLLMIVLFWALLLPSEHVLSQIFHKFHNAPSKIRIFYFTFYIPD